MPTPGFGDPRSAPSRVSAPLRSSCTYCSIFSSPRSTFNGTPGLKTAKMCSPGEFLVLGEVVSPVALLACGEEGQDQRGRGTGASSPAPEPLQTLCRLVSSCSAFLGLSCAGDWSISDKRGGTLVWSSLWCRSARRRQTSDTDCHLSARQQSAQGRDCTDRCVRQATSRSVTRSGCCRQLQVWVAVSTRFGPPCRAASRPWRGSPAQRSLDGVS
jgi:hypothetical protein